MEARPYGDGGSGRHEICPYRDGGLRCMGLDARYVFAFCYAFDRSYEAFAVHFECYALRVFAVVFGFDVNRELVPAVYLSPASQAGFYFVCAVFVAFGYQVVLVPEGWAGAYYAHFA